MFQHAQYRHKVITSIWNLRKYFVRITNIIPNVSQSQLLLVNRKINPCCTAAVPHKTLQHISTHPTANIKHINLCDPLIRHTHDSGYAAFY